MYYTIFWIWYKIWDDVQKIWDLVHKSGVISTWYFGSRTQNSDQIYEIRNLVSTWNSGYSTQISGCSSQNSWCGTENREMVPPHALVQGAPPFGRQFFAPTTQACIKFTYLSKEHPPFGPHFLLTRPYLWQGGYTKFGIWFTKNGIWYTKFQDLYIKFKIWNSGCCTLKSW